VPQPENTKVAAFQALYEKGMNLINENKDDEGMAVLYEAAKVAPEGWLALAIQLIKDGQHELAMARLEEVVKLSPVPQVRAAAINNIGMILANSGRNEDGMARFLESASLAPEFADTWSNIALLHKWGKDYGAAMEYINRGLAKDPWHEQAQFVRAMIYLMSGDYANGFREYECRWRSKSNGLKKIITPYPEWNGSNGKNLLVYGEQGAGDAILVLRYARLIKERGVRQMWVAQKPLTRLLRAMPEIDYVIEVGELLPDYDTHIPAVSLPYIFGTTISTIPPAPYIARPDPIDYGPGFHVGIVWRGAKTQANDLFRSTNLSVWAPVLNTPGVTFHSLQVDGAEEGLLFPQLTQHEAPKDWLETASRVCGLNLVISVDTGMVHLCGALDAPCWVPMHCRPYWVYPPMAGDKTPWYKSLKLYWQEKELEWAGVFGRIATDLCTLINQRQ